MKRVCVLFMVFALSPTFSEAACLKSFVPPFNDQHYYATAQSLTGHTLHTALHTIIRNHQRFTYKCVWDILMDTDQDVTNSDLVQLLYLEHSISKSQRDQGQNDNNSWNREHVWAKSHGFPRQGQHAYTDVHHLRPADRSINSSRGNKEFDNGGSSHHECAQCRTDSNSWEPGDQMNSQGHWQFSAFGKATLRIQFLAAPAAGAHTAFVISLGKNIIEQHEGKIQKPLTK